MIEGVFLSHFGHFIEATLACASKLRELKVKGMRFVTVARYPYTIYGFPVVCPLSLFRFNPRKLHAILEWRPYPDKILRR